MNIIKEFKGEYNFLSNYFPCKVEYNGYVYDSSEAAFHSRKCPGHEADYVGMDADTSKHYCRKLPLREDWEDIKLDIMYEVVKAKFTQNTSLREKLLATGDAELQEGNWWWDSYWGVYQGKGENHLGKILMKVREELNNEKND